MTEEEKCPLPQGGTSMGELINLDDRRRSASTQKDEEFDEPDWWLLVDDLLSVHGYLLCTDHGKPWEIDWVVHLLITLLEARSKNEVQKYMRYFLDNLATYP